MTDDTLWDQSINRVIPLIDSNKQHRCHQSINRVIPLIDSNKQHRCHQSINTVISLIDSQFGPHDAFLESSFNTLGVERLKIQKTLKVLRARKLKGQTRIVNIGYGHRWLENDNKLAKTMVTDVWRMTINWPKRWSHMPGEGQ